MGELGGTNRVQLAVSAFKGFVGVSSGYHTSVVVNEDEYYFNHRGVMKRRRKGFGSHHDLIELVDLGGSIRTGDDLCDALAPHFTPGSYDLILKNCNSFTDAAIHFLLGLRLSRECSSIERVIGQHLSMLESITLGYYTRNPEATNFCLEDVIALYMSFNISC